MPDELKALAGILGPAAAIIGGIAGAAGLAVILNNGVGSIGGAMGEPATLGSLGSGSGS